MFEFQTVRDVINFAVSLERVSQKLYNELAEEVTDAGVRQFLLQMAKEEAIHEEQLRSLLESGDQDLSGDVDPAELHSYMQAMQIPDVLDYKRAVKIAYDKEKASQMLYMILANAAGVDYIKRLLTLLAKQGAKHREFFAHEYDRIRLSEN